MNEDISWGKISYLITQSAEFPIPNLFTKQSSLSMQKREEVWTAPNSPKGMHNN